MNKVKVVLVLQELLSMLDKLDIDNDLTDKAKKLIKELSGEDIQIPDYTSVEINYLFDAYVYKDESTLNRGYYISESREKFYLNKQMIWTNGVKPGTNHWWATEEEAQAFLDKLKELIK